MKILESTVGEYYLILMREKTFHAKIGKINHNRKDESFWIYKI